MAPRPWRGEGGSSWETLAPAIVLPLLLCTAKDILFFGPTKSLSVVSQRRNNSCCSNTTAEKHSSCLLILVLPQHEAWIAIDCNDPTDACEAEVLREQVPVSSAAEPCLSSFVEISEICPSMSRSSSIDNSSQDPATVDAPTQALPKKGGYDIFYPDRSTVISRYKEKRKNRRWDNLTWQFF